MPSTIVPLDDARQDHYAARMVPANETRAVRFLAHGSGWNVCTGEREPRNVMHQVIYWNLTREDALAIAHETGTRAFFC